MNPGRDKVYSNQLRDVYLKSAAERKKYKGRSYKRPPVGNLSSLKVEENDKEAALEKDVISSFSDDCMKDRKENVSEITDGKQEEGSSIKFYQFERVSSSELTTLNEEKKQDTIDENSEEGLLVKPAKFEKILYSDLAQEAREATQRQEAEDNLTKVLEDREKRIQLENNLTNMINKNNGFVSSEEEDTFISTDKEIPSAVQQAITIAQYRQQREYELKGVSPSGTSSSIQDFASIFAEKAKEKLDSSEDVVVSECDLQVDPKELFLREIREKTGEIKEENKKTSFFKKIKQKTCSIFQKVKPQKRDKETVLSQKENDRRKFLTRVKAATAAFIVMTLGVQVHSVVHNAEDDTSSQIKVSQDFLDTEENTFDLSVEIGMGQVATIIKDQHIRTDFEAEVNQDTNRENSQFLLGRSVTLNENMKVYMNEQDAYLEENALSSYYSNQDERVIIGVLVEKEDSMMRFSANQENANEMLQSMLADGGEVVSVLTANKNYVLPDYDGTTTLSAEEVNASAEGWYNVCDISLESAKTLCK